MHHTEKTEPSRGSSTKAVTDMILVRTHANRWIAREKRDRPAVGVITLLNPGEPRSVFRTEAIEIASDERHLLRDSDALEVAFALLLARRVRAASRGSETCDESVAA